jgi:hypothetical protein
LLLWLLLWAAAGARLGIAATIATRYSCVRRQGFMDTAQDISYL